MMEQIGVSAANFGGYRLERYGLGAVGEQQAPSRLEGDRPALLRVKAFAAY